MIKCKPEKKNGVTKKWAEEREKEEKRDQNFARKMQRKYRNLGIDLRLEGVSLDEMLDEMEKADEILDKQDEELDREMEERWDD